MKALSKSMKSKYGSVFWFGILLFLFLAALNFISEELKYFGLKEETLGRYWGIKWWLIGYLSGEILVLALGIFQFWTKLRNSFLKLHRLMGKIYLVGIVLASLVSIYMA